MGAKQSTTAAKRAADSVVKSKKPPSAAGEADVADEMFIRSIRQVSEGITPRAVPQDAAAGNVDKSQFKPLPKRRGELDLDARAPRSMEQWWHDVEQGTLPPGVTPQQAEVLRQHYELIEKKD